MLRRAFCRMLGALGLGGGVAAGTIIRHPFDVIAGENGPVIGHVEGIEAVDMRVFGVRIGDRVEITVMDGGTLVTGEGSKIGHVDIREGGKANFSKVDLITTVNDYRVEIGNAVT